MAPFLYLDSQRGDDYLFWALLARQNKWPLPEDVESVGGQAWTHIAMEKTKLWHPIFRAIAENTQAADTTVWPLMKGTKARPWSSSVVTLIGDALHCMPPTLGLGANSALWEAMILSRKLIDVDRGQISMAKALADCMAETMRLRASGLKASLRVLELATMESQIKRSLYMRVAKVMAAIFPKKGKSFLTAIVRSGR